MLRRVAQALWVLQHPVARIFAVTATFRSVKEWTKWCARARQAKERAGKSDADLSAAVTDIAGRKAGRAQVNHWFTGKREPTLSQFMALCEELGADPGAILFGVPVMPKHASPKIAKALESDPTTKSSYKMQEKRLTMRRDPSRITTAPKKRRTIPA